MLKKMDQFLNKSFSKKQPAQNKADIITLLMNWETIVGSKLAEVSLPQRITNGHLYIVVNHSIYAQHLKQISEMLLEKIFSHYPGLSGKMTDIKFFFSEKAFKEIAQAQQRRSHSEKPAVPFLEQINLHDPKVRASIQQAEQLFSDIEPEIKESLISIYLQEHL